ncbi:hypothetical protein BDV12DRAFT_31388 [Aspergillus spectabilis]
MIGGCSCGNSNLPECPRSKPQTTRRPVLLGCISRRSPIGHQHKCVPLQDAVRQSSSDVPTSRTPARTSLFRAGPLPQPGFHPAALLPRQHPVSVTQYVHAQHDSSFDQA